MLTNWKLKINTRYTKKTLSLSHSRTDSFCLCRFFTATLFAHHQNHPRDEEVPSCPSIIRDTYVGIKRFQRTPNIIIISVVRRRQRQRGRGDLCDSVQKRAVCTNFFGGGFLCNAMHSFVVVTCLAVLVVLAGVQQAAARPYRLVGCFLWSEVFFVWCLNERKIIFIQKTQKSFVKPYFWIKN